MNVGRITIVAAVLIAGIISPFLGIDKKGGFEFIQEYTGFLSPGIFAIFFLGFFWKRTTSSAALTAALITFPLSLLLKALPTFADLKSLSSMGFSAFNTESQRYEIPFLDRMGFVFLICVFMMVVVSLVDPKSKNNPQGLEVDSSMFKTRTGFCDRCYYCVWYSVCVIYTILVRRLNLEIFKSPGLLTGAFCCVSLLRVLGYGTVLVYHDLTVSITRDRTLRRLWPGT